MKVIKSFFYIFIIAILNFSCVSQKIHTDDTNKMKLDRHTNKLIKKFKIKVPENAVFLHVYCYTPIVILEKCEILSEPNVLQYLKPIYLVNSDIQEADTYIIAENRIIAMSDGRYIFTKGFFNGENILKFYYSNEGSLFFSLPYVDLGKLFVITNNGKIKIYDNLISNELIDINEYLLKYRYNLTKTKILK